MSTFCDVNCLLLFTMDQLSADEQENLRKCNSERLRSMAARTGQMGEDDIAAMDRPALLQAAAQDLLSKKELPKDSPIQIDSGRSVQIRDMEIQLELKRIDMENKKNGNGNRNGEKADGNGS